MYQVLIAGPEGCYPGCPIDVNGQAKDFFTSERAHCWNSMDPADLEKCDGVLIPGGLPDVDPACYGEINTACHVVDEEMDRGQMEMIRRAVELRKPIFAICRGLQLVSIYFGATLIQNIGCGKLHKYEPGNPRFHDIYNVPGTMMYELFGAVTHGNSGHHQAIKKLPKCLRVSSLWCADEKKTAEYLKLAQSGELHEGTDECIIESVYHPDYPFIGLQWHPELVGELKCTRVETEKIKTMFYDLMQKEYSGKER